LEILTGDKGLQQILHGGVQQIGDLQGRGGMGRKATQKRGTKQERHRGGNGAQFFFPGRNRVGSLSTKLLSKFWDVFF